MRGRVLVCLAVALGACGSGEPAKPADVGSGSAPAPPIEPPPRTAPHSGAIERIAVTDDGKVAYTIDSFGQARFWPTLDGTRKPILARGGRARKVALGRVEHGFVAALLDEASGIELVRFDADGRTRGHIALAPEPGFLDVLAVRDGVLARRRDEFLVWYDASGRKRGQIAPDPGERIASVAVRRGRAIAALLAPDRRGIELRWIQIGTSIEWGHRVKLRGDVDAPIALSPSGTKIAAIDGATKRFEVIDLVTGDGMYANSSDAVATSPSLGFLDENTAVFSDVRGTTWWALATRDPWATSQRGAPSDTSDVAIGDHVMLDSSSTSLTITTEMSMQYLGYRDIGPSVLWSMRDGVATQRASTTVWLDRELRDRLRNVAPSSQVSAVVGDHHLVIADAGRFSLYDAETKDEAAIGRYEAASVVFDATTSTLVISTQDRANRFRITTSPVTITPLPPLDVQDGGMVTLFDPARTGGVVALVASHEIDGKLRLDWYRDAAEPTATTTRSNDAMVGSDREGRVYFLDRGKNMLSIGQLGTPERTLQLGIDGIVTAHPDPDGSLVMVATASELLAIDASTGDERWKITVPGIDTLTFSQDGKTLFASARGGMTSLDPRTGTRIATACGWSFGLHDEQVSAQIFGVPNLCAGLE